MKQFVACFFLIIGLSCTSDFSAQELSKPNLVILATGGAISARSSNSTDTRLLVGEVDVRSILAQSIEALRLANIKAEQLAQIASQAMTDDVWFKLAIRVQELVDDPGVDGVIITHGTDTLEETAYFLNLVIKTKKPIVVTGATRSIDQLSADGPKNLYDSVVLAASPQSRAKGVMVCFNGKIFSAREVAKTHTYNPDGMAGHDIGFMGYIYGDDAYFYQVSTRKHTYLSQFDISKTTTLPRVEIIYGHANMHPDMLDAAVAAGAKGIVYAGVGNGNVHPVMMESLKKAYQQGVRIVRSTRVENGLVTRGAEVKDSTPDLQFVVSDTLSPQKARILLALSLLKTTDPQELQQKFDAY